MKQYNHRDVSDLNTLKCHLSTLTGRQKALIWTALVRMGVFRPLWPIRLAVWFNHQLYGDRDLLARTANAWEKLTLWEKEWQFLLAHLVGGKNVDDPTSAGGFNHRDLNALLSIAATAGWRPPDAEERSEVRDPEAGAC